MASAQTVTMSALMISRGIGEPYAFGCRRRVLLAQIVALFLLCLLGGRTLSIPDASICLSK